MGCPLPHTTRAVWKGSAGPTRISLFRSVRPPARLAPTSIPGRRDGTGGVGEVEGARHGDADVVDGEEQMAGNEGVAGHA